MDPKNRMPCYRPMPKQRLVAKEGYLYIGAALFCSVLAYFFAGPLALGIFLCITFYIITFFRNPNRPFLEGDGLIVSPADGKIIDVSECEEENYLKTKAKKISIFMSPCNCHINRAPVEGIVEQCFYKTGSFHAAFSEKSMAHNEHHAVLMRDPGGHPWLVVQIAGWLARRIVSYVEGGENLGRGDRFGLIQFGSRVDLYCPLHCNIFVKPGDKVKAGKTILGMERGR